MVDPAAQAFAAQGVYRAGVAVTFLRTEGVSPNVITTSAAVTAILRGVLADPTEEAQTGYSGSQVGAITQDDRQCIVVAADLCNAGFPLPVAKGDKIVETTSGEKFTITRVDAYKRALSGTIEIVCVGVA
jgi:hypothetical protein